LAGLFFFKIFLNRVDSFLNLLCFAAFTGFDENDSENDYDAELMNEQLYKMDMMVSLYFGIYILLYDLRRIFEKNYLQTFFKNCSSNNVCDFNTIAQRFMNKGEIKLLKSIL
jgi:hypothetical protein